MNGVSGLFTMVRGEYGREGLEGRPGHRIKVAEGRIPQYDCLRVSVYYQLLLEREVRLRIPHVWEL